MNTRTIITLALALPLAWAEPAAPSPAAAVPAAEASGEAAALSRFPAEQVRAVQAHRAVLMEVNSILAGSGTEEEKLAALRTLHPRLPAVAEGLRDISAYRHSDITEALAASSSPTPALAQVLNPDLIFTSGDDVPPLTQAVIDILRRMNPRDVTADSPLSAIAEHLPRYLRELEDKLNNAALGEEEHINALWLYRDRLVYLTMPLMAHQRELGASTCYREVECQLQPAGEAPARHLAFIRQRLKEAPAGSELRDALEEYERHATGLMVLTLSKLTEEGRANLAAIRAFVEESPHVLHGTLDEAESEAPNEFELDVGLLSPDIILRLEEGNAALPTLREELAYGSVPVLVRYQPERMETGSRGEPAMLHGVKGSEIRIIKGINILERALEESPELRQKVKRPRRVELSH